ncbi:MAG: sulfotransferase family protein [Sphingomonadaceae bacterium]|nr:MAG: sulfotransferase family protein [Sphingomonadaceae bacterium]
MNELLDQAEAAMRQGRFAEARSTIEQALGQGLDTHQQSEARSMLGLAMVATGEAAAALDHLNAAVAAEPAEAMFRYNLGRGLEAVGDAGGAVRELREAVRLAPGMMPLEVALAQVLLRTGNAGEARGLLESHAADPQAPADVTRMLVQAQAGVGDTHAALDTARRLLPPDLNTGTGPYAAQQRVDVMSAASLAHAAMHYEESAQMVRALLERNPSDAEAATLLGQLLLWMQGPEAAREVLASAQAAGARSPRLLVDLIALDGDEQAIARAKAELGDSNLPDSDRIDLLLALAQYQDRAGTADLAWDLASQGKALLAAGEQRDWPALLERQRQLCRETQSVASLSGGPQHLYLLGLPRSGQSLVQSVLAAAPDISSVGERGALLQHLLFREKDIVAMPAGQRRALLHELSQADRRGIQRLVGAPEWIVDKSPLHLSIAGNVAKVHPEARFAAVLRDPADVAVSIWLRRFPPVYDYTNDFKDLLDHIEFAIDALAAWRRDGIDIRIIDFERFVAQPEVTGKALFDWLGVEWSAAYLDPQSRTEPVPTYSAAQVRQPVGKGGGHGAQPYAERLAPFAQRLSRIREKQAGLLPGE